MSEQQQIMAVGTKGFLLGFQLAGIRNSIIANEHDINDIHEKISQCKNAGIVLVDEHLLDQLSPIERGRLETQVAPVVMALGPNGEKQIERLRHQVQNILGVDLLR